MEPHAETCEITIFIYNLLLYLPEDFVCFVRIVVIVVSIALILIDSVIDNEFINDPR